jgi:transposase
MAPRLARSQLALIEATMHDTSLNDEQRAEIGECTTRTIRRIRSNTCCFGSPKAPSNGAGRPRSITPPMLDALCERLIEKPYLYQDEMVVFLWDEFEILVTTHSISRALASIRWSKKIARRIAKERNADLRDFYLQKLSAYRSYHLVYIDESGCDKRAGFRRTGWSPLGVAPVQIARFHRGRRYQILPAYAQDGIVHLRIFQGSTDGALFESFIEELLSYCGRWPEPKSVLVMDNASFHRSDRIEQLCRDAGVVLLYLPPYSPDLNPIEEFFAELKTYIRRNWSVYADLFGQDFAAFLEWCAETVGAKVRSAHGHFRHAGIEIEEP